MITAHDLRGLWRRKWIKAPGFEDHDTRVFWAQSDLLYADIRIPRTRPDMGGVQALCQLDPRSLHALMSAEGFAGTIRVEGSVCTWARDINWHGASEAIDAGEMWFDPKGGLIEDGIHADYRELWHLAAPPPLEARRIAADGMQGVLVYSDEVFLFALGLIGRPGSQTVLDALARGETEGVRTHFRSEYTFGHWHGSDGVAEICTNPLRESQTVLTRAQSRFVWHQQSFDGDLTDHVLS